MCFVVLPIKKSVVVVKSSCCVGLRVCKMNEALIKRHDIMAINLMLLQLFVF